MVLYSINSWSQEWTADKIINKSIEVHGGDNYQNAHFSYDFRQFSYEYHYDNGQFLYRRYSDETKTLDQLSNDGFERKINGKKVRLPDEDARKYSRSVNSVRYFAFLPFFLNDPAVNKVMDGAVRIKGQDYFKIRVTFDAEGGGEDHDDIFVYWINKETFYMDYLAYSYVVEGGGVRFRSAYNRRKIGGITFQDYVNYKYEKGTDVSSLDQLYVEDALEELSRIELKSIQIIAVPN